MLKMSSISSLICLRSKASGPVASTLLRHLPLTRQHSSKQRDAAGEILKSPDPELQLASRVGGRRDEDQKRLKKKRKKRVKAACPSRGGFQGKAASAGTEQPLNQRMEDGGADRRTGILLDAPAQVEAARVSAPPPVRTTFLDVINTICSHPPLWGWG